MSTNPSTRSDDSIAATRSEQTRAVFSKASKKEDLSNSKMATFSVEGVIGQIMGANEIDVSFMPEDTRAPMTTLLNLARGENELTEDEQRRALLSSTFEILGAFIPKLKEAEKKTNSPYANATEEEKIAAVQKDARALREMYSSGIVVSEEVKIAAVQKQTGVISHIYAAKDTVSEAVKIAAVTKYGGALWTIYKSGDTASEDVKIAAVSQNGHSIRHIYNAKDTVSEAVKIAAVEENGCALRDIYDVKDTVSEAVKIAAVRKDRSALRYILSFGDTVNEAVEAAAAPAAGVPMTAHSSVRGGPISTTTLRDVMRATSSFIDDALDCDLTVEHVEQELKKFDFVLTPVIVFLFLQAKLCRLPEKETRAKLHRIFEQFIRHSEVLPA